MEDSIFTRHLLDLADRANAGCFFTFSDFLGLSEQSDFLRAVRDLPTPYTLFGGTEGCERLMVRFGDPEAFGYETPFPIACLFVRPKTLKFADALTHRDYLGALMNLGLSREVIGDIVVDGEVAYLFCEEKIAPYIAENLTRVRHTVVIADITDRPPACAYGKTESLRLPVVSERLDVLLANVYRLSRGDASDLVEKGTVFVDGRQITSPGTALKPGAVVSVRGHGRFVYRGVDGNSKKGKDIVVIEKYV